TDQPAEHETSNLPRRSILKGTTVAAATLGALGGIALPGGVASAAARTPRITGTSAGTSSSKDTGAGSFKFRLEASKPQVFAGGTNRSVVAGDIEELSGLSMFSQRINPGAMRELHWHPNANELSHCL